MDQTQLHLLDCLQFFARTREIFAKNSITIVYSSLGKHKNLKPKLGCLPVFRIFSHSKIVSLFVDIVTRWSKIFYAVNEVSENVSFTVRACDMRLVYYYFYQRIQRLLADAGFSISVVKLTILLLFICKSASNLFEPSSKKVSLLSTFNISVSTCSLLTALSPAFGVPTLTILLLFILRSPVIHPDPVFLN